jgi:hypothetical protein
LGKHDLPGNRSQKVAASHILYYYTKYIFNFMTRDHTLFFRIVQSEVVFFPYSNLRWVSPGTRLPPPIKQTTMIQFILVKTVQKFNRQIVCLFV